MLTTYEKVPPPVRRGWAFLSGVLATSALTASLFVLGGCQPCEGPIVVGLAGMDDTAVVTWAVAGGADFQPCRDAIDPNYADCGPDDDEASGLFTVRVAWDSKVFEQEVAVESDSSCTENVYVTFSADDATVTGSAGA